MLDESEIALLSSDICTFAFVLRVDLQFNRPHNGFDSISSVGLGST